MAVKASRTKKAWGKCKPVITFAKTCNPNLYATRSIHLHSGFALNIYICRLLSVSKIDRKCHSEANMNASTSYENYENALVYKEVLKLQFFSEKMKNSSTVLRKISYNGTLKKCYVH